MSDGIAVCFCFYKGKNQKKKGLLPLQIPKGENDKIIFYPCCRAYRLTSLPRLLDDGTHTVTHQFGILTLPEIVAAFQALSV